MGSILFGAVGALLVNLAVAPTLAVFGVLIVSGFMIGMGTVTYNVNQVSLRQAITPNRLLGRMNASMRFLVWGTIPLGALIGGALGDAIGLRPTILIGTLGGLTSFLWIFFSPVRKLKTQPEPVEE